MAIDLSGGISTSREYLLAEKPANHEMRDAVNVWIASADGSFGMRIGIEALAATWDAHDTWLDIAFANGRVISFRESHKPASPLDEHGLATIRGAGPVMFQCVTPFQRWRVAFRGFAPETTAAHLASGNLINAPNPVAVDFDIELSMAAPPWVPGSLLQEAAETLTGNQGEHMSPRYEQLFRAQGSLRVGEKCLDVKGSGLRIRRQGVRRLEGFSGHCWQSAVFPSGKAFGFNVYPPREDGEPSYNEGFIFDGTGVLQPARAVRVPWLDRLQVSGDDVSFVLETPEGEVSVAGTTFINTRSVNKGSAILPPEFPIVQQAHARYHWDGEESCGMVERSSQPYKIAH
ncbi:MAG: hypothetical protein KDI33_06450 [Halioglobus sp.]|nr:hypothetical protein [Halioglobus sp.]